MIRTLLLSVAIALSTAIAGKPSTKEPVHLSGYTTNGTVVAPEDRHAPGTATSTDRSPVALPSTGTLASSNPASPVPLPGAIPMNRSPVLPNSGNAAPPVRIDPPIWSRTGSTYPLFLSHLLAWRTDDARCLHTGAEHEQAFLMDGTGQVMAWRGTSGYVADLPLSQVQTSIDRTNITLRVSGRNTWKTVDNVTSREVSFNGLPQVYLTEIHPLSATTTIVCVTVSVPR